MDPGTTGQKTFLPASRIPEVSEKIRQGLYREALVLLDLIGPDPMDPLVSTLRGRAQEGLGEFEAAETEYWNALSGTPPVLEPFLCLGLLKDRLGDREKGLWVLEEGLNLFPDNPDLQREAGILYGLTGQWDRALPYILSAYRADPDREENILALGPVVDHLNLSELFSEMHRGFKLLLSRKPGNPDVEDWYGRSLERMEKSQQALKFFRSLLRKNPRDKRLLGQVARLARNVNEPVRAIDTYRLLMEETGESVELYLEMAETSKMSGKPLAALPLVRRVEALDPGNPEARILLAMIAIDQGDPEKAEKALEGINHAPAHYQLGELHLRRKSPKEAMWSFILGFSVRPDPHYGMDLLRLLLSEGEDFLFLETLAWMTLLFPDSRPGGFLLKKASSRFAGTRSDGSPSGPEQLAIHGLANALLPGGDRDLAYKLLEQAVTVDPLSEVLYWVLAMIDEDHRQWTRAVEWYMKVIKSSREPVTLLHRIAENRHNQDPRSRLEDLLEEFSLHYGMRPGFFRVLAEVSSRTGPVETSLEILRRGMLTFPEDPSLFEQFRALEPEKWRKILTHS